jgi:DNA ligase 1
MFKPKIYKIDSKGKIRVWWMEYHDDKYCTHSGILDGKIVTSGWIYPEQKNIGKANETTISEQVLFEVESEYNKKLNQGNYHFSLTDIDDGAKYFEPMLAKSKKDVKITFPIYSSPKLDGIRCIAKPNGLFTREGKDIISCIHIEEHLIELFKMFPNIILDGELYNHKLKNDFEKIVSLVRKTKPKDSDYIECRKLVEYHIYDCFDKNNPNLTYKQRIEFLRDVFTQSSLLEEYFVLVDSTIVNNEEELTKLFGEYIAEGYEGQMLRVIDSPYQNKRTKFLIKNKEFEDAEFKIVDIEEGVGNWAGHAKRVFIELENRNIQGSGMSGDFTKAKQILKDKEILKSTYATVRFQGRTSDGMLRFPVVKHFWYGKRNV